MVKAQTHVARQGAAFTGWQVKAGPQDAVKGSRVGLFGLLGSGNIGNDASMEAILRYLRSRHPAAVIDAICSGPATVTEEYGIDAVQMFCFDRHPTKLSGRLASVLRLSSRLLDAFRIPAWVRRHDVVIVPGAGVLEASLPLRPWNTPYGLFLLSVSGKLFGTKVAFVSVGAGLFENRATRWLSDRAARAAFYRSYRDAGSREAMHRRGLDARDPIFPDLAFSLPLPADHCDGSGDWSTIGVGIMAYEGSDDERDRAREIYAWYVGCLKELVRWLVGDGRKVRLFIGDTDGSDEATAREILSDVRTSRPDLDESWVMVEKVTTFSEIMEAMEPLGAVIATRFHNLIAAMMLAKPTIAIGYAPKHSALMSDMGLTDFSHMIASLDVRTVTEQFLDMERRSAELQKSLAVRASERATLLDEQFNELDRVVFGQRTAARPGIEPVPSSMSQETS
jgi:polysaccharide pyruvyl transferase WcaK-like protein